MLRHSDYTLKKYFSEINLFTKRINRLKKIDKYKKLDIKIFESCSLNEIIFLNYQSEKYLKIILEEALTDFETFEAKINYAIFRLLKMKQCEDNNNE